MNSILNTDELKAGEVTNDAICEWWTQTRDQYPDEIDYEEVEKLINN